MNTRNAMWEFICFLAMCFFSFSLLSAVAGLIVLCDSLFDFEHIQSPDSFFPRLMSGLKSIMFLIPTWWFARIHFEGPLFDNLSLRLPKKKALYAVVVISFFISFPIRIWLQEINEALPAERWMIFVESAFNDIMNTISENQGLLELIINVGLFAFVPAVCEEVFFRGTLQRVLINLFKKPWIGVLASSLLFAGLHLQVHSFLPVLFSGILLGLLSFHSGSVSPGIILHFTNNALVVISAGLIPNHLVMISFFPHI